jgi:hypothetical protein
MICGMCGMPDTTYGPFMDICDPVVHDLREREQLHTLIRGGVQLEDTAWAMKRMVDSCCGAFNWGYLRAVMLSRHADRLAVIWEAEFASITADLDVAS